MWFIILRHQQRRRPPFIAAIDMLRPLSIIEGFEPISTLIELLAVDTVCIPRYKTPKKDKVTRRNKKNSGIHLAISSHIIHCSSGARA
jgi:hypothetical protein